MYFYKKDREYNEWLDKCIRYKDGFVAFSEKNNCWLGIDGNLIIKREDAESYARKINYFINGDKS